MNLARRFNAGFQSKVVPVPKGTADSHASQSRILPGSPGVQHQRTTISDGTRDPAMIQPSLTGLVHALFATQHCVLGYYQAVPAGL